MKILAPISLAAVGLIAVGCSLGQAQSTVANEGDTPVIVDNGDATDASVTTVYECEAEKARQQGTLLPVQGALKFTYVSEGNSAKLKNLVGFVAVNYDFNVQASAEDNQIDNYTGAFAGEFANDPNYNGTTYTNHHAFKEFNAGITGRTDGGGMWGYLALNKDNGTDDIDAHYVFQSGDHIGGTVDLMCEIIEAE